jgi:peptidyl-tRNA hydrolase, PTH1 family
VLLPNWLQLVLPLRLLVQRHQQRSKLNVLTKPARLVTMKARPVFCRDGLFITLCAFEFFYMPSQIPVTPIRLIVGLGNPGPEYEQTRHNAGFWYVDAIAKQLGTSFNKETKFAGWVAKARGPLGDVWLLKPNTFMNRSGQAVQALCNFYKITVGELLVLHDELDLMPGAIKLKKGGGTGGHNGLKDIQAKMGSTDYWRLRIGIGHPRTLNLAQEVADFVLHQPRRDEEQAILANEPKVLGVLPQMLQGDLETAFRVLHTV